MPNVRYAKVRRYAPFGIGSTARPVLRVRLQHAEHASRQTPEFLALVDSGADVSLFHSGLARLLGIDLTACETAEVGGLGGAVFTYTCPVRLVVEGHGFGAVLHFRDAVDPALAILGRRDVFDEFKIGFDQRAKRVLFGRYR